MNKPEKSSSTLFGKKRADLPASWAGVDLTVAHTMPHGEFSELIVAAKDPLFGLPEMPTSIDHEVMAFLASSPLAREFYPYLVKRIAGYRDAFKREVTSQTRDPAQYRAAEILADFRRRLDNHAAGFTHLVSGWRDWGDCDPPPRRHPGRG